MVTNYAYVYGEVATRPVFDHAMDRTDMYSFFIKVMRRSGNCDILPVHISARLLRRHKIVQGDKLGIAGQFHSYSYRKDGSCHLRLYIYATVVRKEVAEAANYIALSGTICKPPVYRTTLNGYEVTDLMMAINRQNGRSDYIPAIVWNTNARFTADLPVGTHVVLIGRMQSRNYNKVLPDGNIQLMVAYEASAFFVEATLKRASVTNYIKEAPFYGDVT